MPEVRLIDAYALMEKVCGNCQGDDCLPDATDTVYGCMLAESVEEAPTIEAEPVRHGLWISEIVQCTDWKGQKRKRFQPTSCSVCHTPVADATNFCPNCGARMDGGADNA